MIFRLSINGCLTDFALTDCLFAQLERLAIIRQLISGSSTQQLFVFLFYLLLFVRLSLVFVYLP